MPLARTRCLVLVLVLLGLAERGGVLAQGQQAQPVTLTVMVGMTPQELDSFRPALAAVDEAHPEFVVELEPVPQGAFAERVNARLAAGTLPDLVRIEGLSAQRWIRRDAFLALDSLPGFDAAVLDDYFPGVLEPFRWQGALWALPDTASPDVLFYDKAAFDEAGLAYPTDDWTFEDMREAAIALTRDAEGRSPRDPAFDPDRIVRWGWNGSLTHMWQRHLVQAFGADWCADELCTTFDATDPDVVAAARWWADLVQVDHAGLYDPYSGGQTGVPGDPFLSGAAAMGYNGFFAVGQLNDVGGIDYDVAQPLLGVDGQRHTPLSTNGYAIAATSPHPTEALALLSELTATGFLAETWGRPGHAVPARRSAAGSIVDPSRAPANQEAILAAMEYATVFRPFTPSAFEAYGLTADLFARTMRGEVPVEEGLAEIERVLNDALAADRQP
ncbi:MAG TPA: extracellular solute-binding protein [Trueperaceae bacterium]|jgi:multiple sugar transport system substrate-binding protein|nr:extracellular solute-binding protein [Trueperaceae bacterium]